MGVKSEMGRFVSFCRKNGDCIVWTGQKSGERYGQSYGRFHVNGRSIGAHRWIYEHIFGSVGDDLEIDHLCHNRMCVNVAHLEAVSHAENMSRSKNFKTHCRHGHPYIPTNILIEGSKRRCRTCRQKHWKQQYVDKLERRKS